MAHSSITRAWPLLAVLPLGACAGPLNTESSVGRVWTPASIERSQMIEVTGESAPTVDQHDSPVYAADGVLNPRDARASLTGVSREDWAPTPLPVPNDQPAHQPIFTRSWFDTTAQIRSRGTYPTPQSALDTGSKRQNEAQMREAVMAPLAAGADVALLPVRLIGESRPARPTRQGSRPYQRLPEQRVEQPTPVSPFGPASVVVVSNMLPPPGYTTPAEKPTQRPGEAAVPAVPTNQPVNPGTPGAPAATPAAAPAPASSQPSTATPPSSRPGGPR